MNWNQALNLIILNIRIGLQLNRNSAFRFVINTPPYPCNRNGFNGLDGFRVQIGRNDFIEIPLLMLENIHNTSMHQNGGIYNRRIIQFLYPNLAHNKPCIVQTVGKIFEFAGVAAPLNRFEYQLL